MDYRNLIIQLGGRLCIGILMLWALSFTVKTEHTTFGRSFLTNILLSFPPVLFILLALNVFGATGLSITVPAFSPIGILSLGLFAVYMAFSFGLIKWMYKISVPETVWMYLAVAMTQLYAGKVAVFFHMY